MSKISIDKTLRNGIKLQLLEYGSHITRQTVNVKIEIEAGSKYEQEHEWGLAHYLEHMAFKGTTTKDNVTIMKSIDQYGSFNAHTDFNQIVFTALIHSKYLEQTLELLYDVIQNSDFKPQEIEKERGAINQEISTYDSDPASYVTEDLISKMFRGNFTRKIIGTEESISKFTTEDFLQYKKKHYIAENTTIQLIGLYNETQILDILEKTFGSMPNGEVTKVEESYYVGGELVSYDLQDIEQSNLSVYFKGYKKDQFAESNYASILSNILTGGFAARLNNSMRAERGLVYSVSTFPDCATDFGTFVFDASTSPENVNLILDLFAKEIRDIIENGVKKEEFEKWTTRLIDLYEMSEWDPDYLSQHIEFFYRKGKIYSYEEMLEITKSFNNKETLQKVTKEMLEDSLPSIAIYGTNPPKININDFIAKIQGKLEIIIPEVNTQHNHSHSEIMHEHITSETGHYDLQNNLIGQEPEHIYYTHHE